MGNQQKMMNPKSPRSAPVQVYQDSLKSSCTHASTARQSSTHTPLPFWKVPAVGAGHLTVPLPNLAHRLKVLAPLLQRLQTKGTSSNPSKETALQGAFLASQALYG